MWGMYRNVEGMPVMRVARRLDREVQRLLRRYGRWMGPDTERHLHKTMDSVLFNLGEAAARVSPGQKAYHYAVTQGETGEMLAGLHTLVDRKIVPAAEARLGCSYASQLMGHLSRLARHHHSKKP